MENASLQSPACLSEEAALGAAEGMAANLSNGRPMKILRNAAIEVAGGLWIATIVVEYGEIELSEEEQQRRNPELRERNQPRPETNENDGVSLFIRTGTSGGSQAPTLQEGDIVPEVNTQSPLDAVDNDPTIRQQAYNDTPPEPDFASRDASDVVIASRDSVQDLSAEFQTETTPTLADIEAREEAERLRLQELTVLQAETAAEPRPDPAKAA